MLASHVHSTRHYMVSLQPPSTGIVFIKFPSVLDSLCNHKEHATRWADDETPTCTCSGMRGFSKHPVPEDQHIILDGDSLHFDDKPLTSIATGSLENKIFPPHKEISTSLGEAVTSWAKKNHFHQFPVKHWLTFGTGLGSDALPSDKITSLTSTMSDSNNSSTMLCSTMRTNELHHSEYTVRVFTMNTCRTPSETPRFFGKWTPTPRK